MLRALYSFVVQVGCLVLVVYIVLTAVSTMFRKRRG